jgi:hypothetical protein
MANQMENNPDENGPSENPPLPVPLEYQERGSEPYHPKTPRGVQVIAGFITWVAGLAFVVRVAQYQTWASPYIDRQIAMYCAIAATLIAIGFLTIWLRLRFRWRGFLPGLLIGFSAYVAWFPSELL